MNSMNDFYVASYYCYSGLSEDPPRSKLYINPIIRIQPPSIEFSVQVPVTIFMDVIYYICVT